MRWIVVFLFLYFIPLIVLALGGEYHTPEGASVWLADVELEPYQALLVKNK